MICIYTYVLYIYIYIFTYTYDNQSATCPPKELTLFPEELKVFKAAPERCPPAGCADVSWAQATGVRCWETRRSWWNTTAMRQGAMALGGKVDGRSLHGENYSAILE